VEDVLNVMFHSMTDAPGILAQVHQHGVHFGR